MNESSSIKPVIENAKAAQNKIKVSEAPLNDEDQQALNALKNRLESGFKTEKVSTDPDDLKKVQWHRVGEKPGDAPPSVLTIEKPEKKYEDKKTRNETLQKQTDQILKDKPYLRSIITSVDEFQWDNLRPDWTQRPEELNLLILNLDNYGIGTSDRYENRSLSESIGTAYKFLRASYQGQQLNPDRPQWDYNGVEGTPHFEDISVSILENLKSVRKGQRQEITQDDLNVCILSALSCGDPYTAMRLIQSADQFLPEQGKSAISSALSRFANPEDKNNIFNQVYELYPEQVKDRLNEVLSSLGEEQFADLTDVPMAMAIKKQVGKRLENRLKKQRDLWLREQTVARTDLRKNELDKPHLSEMVDQAAENEKEWQTIAKAIEEKAAHFVDGQAANIIAAELQRRLRPELDLDRQMRIHKDKGLRKFSENFSYTQYNNYENNGAYGYETLSNDGNTNQKAERINQINMSEREIMENIWQPNQIGVRELVILLKNPNLFDHYLSQGINNYEKKAMNATSYSYDRKRFDQGYNLLAKKMINGVSFLQTIADVPEIKAVLQKEFGFKEMVNADNLDKAAEKLQTIFNKIINKETDMTLYESMLEEGQLDEDARVAQQIAKLIPKETGKIAEVKEDEAIEITGEMTDAAMKKNNELKLKFEQLKEPKVKKNRLKGTIDDLEKQRKNIEVGTTVKKAIQKIGKPKGTMTETEQAERLKSFDKQIKTSSEQLEQTEAEISTIGEVSPEDVQTATKKAQKLQKIKSTIPTT